jgi:hypothetical protein
MWHFCCGGFGTPPVGSMNMGNHDRIADYEASVDRLRGGFGRVLDFALVADQARRYSMRAAIGSLIFADTRLGGGKGSDLSARSGLICRPRWWHQPHAAAALPCVGQIVLIARR